MKKCLLFFLYLFPVYLLAQDGCIQHCTTPDSFDITVFCGEYKHNAYDKYEIPQWQDSFTYRDTLRYADVPYWVVDSVEAGLAQALKTLNRQKINQDYGCPDIESYLKSYHRQYMAYYNKQGEVVVLVNFIFKTSGFSEGHLTRPVFVMDGCSYYWKVRYNPKTGKFFDLEINGEA